MKKTSIFLLTILAVTMLTSCIGDDDPPVNKFTFPTLINNRVINGDEVYFSQTNANVELNYTDMTIQFNANYKDASGQTQNISTPVMTITSMGNSSICKFGPSEAGIEGFIDVGSRMMWYHFTDGDHAVFTCNQPLYCYNTTTVTNPDNGNEYKNELSEYQFIIDEKGETCDMWISYFTPNIVGTIMAEKIKYTGLTVTPTTTGYTITASKTESNMNGYYTITDAEFMLNDQGLLLDGSFKCSDLDFKVSGRLYPSFQ